MKYIYQYVKKYRIITITFIILSALSYPFKYVWISNSDAYEVPRKYINNSMDIHQKLGQIEEINFNTLHSTMSYYNGKGEATFYITVLSNGKIHKIKISLERNARVWEVMTVNINETAYN